MASSLLNAPRALKDPVCWRFSSLRKGPIGEGSSGVSRIQERMRRSAREIASGSPAAAVIVAGREGCRTLAVASRGAGGRSGRRGGRGRRGGGAGGGAAAGGPVWGGGGAGGGRGGPPPLRRPRRSRRSSPKV